jgi:hypothetical protein
MPLHVLQNGKAECTIHTINNVIRTLLIQASLPGRYWAEGLHTVMYLLNRLPMKMISVVCPHVTLFGSTPLYEHLRVFGCASYPNIAATAPHKLTPRSTRCVFLGYSADHKGYRCLDLSANHLIVSRHVIFDDDSFPFTASSSLTYLNFLCESGPMVSTIGTHLTTAGTSTLTPHRPTLEIPLGFEPPCGSPTRPSSSSSIPAPGGYHGYATCHHRRPATPYMVSLTGCLRPAGG